MDGYALGGLSLGEEKPAMFEMIETVIGLLPPDRPRYLMGVGLPEDIVEGVARGLDLFDCVIPTRSGRFGRAYIGYCRPKDGPSGRAARRTNVRRKRGYRL